MRASESKGRNGPEAPGRMPVLFVGHGNPMNAIEDNDFSRGWREVAAALPRLKAILCISAHWETWGTLVTAMEKPRTIHDFGGFPRALYQVQYPAPGNPSLAQDVRQTIHATQVALDSDWGFDHGCWSVLKQMLPRADVPVVQLSLDASKPAQAHYDLAMELMPFRTKGILVLGSGNMVHNLRRIALPQGSMGDFNTPFGLDWALEASELFKKLIAAGDHQALVDYHALGPAVQLAVPTPEHYLPMLYALALRQPGEPITFFNDVPVAGSLTMTSFKVG